MHISLCGIYSTTDRALNVRQLVLLFLHLFNLHLLNVLSDLLSQKIFQLVSDLVSSIKLLRQVVWVITLTDENVLATSFTNLYRQSQNLLGL